MDSYRTQAEEEEVGALEAYAPETDVDGAQSAVDAAEAAADAEVEWGTTPEAEREPHLVPNESDLKPRSDPGLTRQPAAASNAVVNSNSSIFRSLSARSTRAATVSPGPFTGWRPASTVGHEADAALVRIAASGSRTARPEPAKLVSQYYADDGSSVEAQKRITTQTNVWRGNQLTPRQFTRRPLLQASWQPRRAGTPRQVGVAR